jgi:type IV pilus assembly protein PilE
MKTRYLVGFTLVELLTVVAVMAILAAIAYPSYRSAVLKTKRTEGRAALMRLMQQEEGYYSQNTSYIAFSSASTDEEAKKFRWYSGDAQRASAYEISAEACAEETLRNCVKLVATPGTGKVDSSFQDKECGKLTLTSTGIKSASGSATDCWK